MALIKNFTYSLAANERKRVDRIGNFIRCISASLGFNVSFEDEEKVQIQAGVGVSFEESFNYMVIENGATPQTVTLYIGTGSVQDSRFYGSINALITPGAALTSPADVTIATATTNSIALNAARRAITVGAFSTNTDVLRVGGTGAADATHGVELQPGMSYRFESTFGIDIFNGTGVNQKYWVIEES